MASYRQRGKNKTWDYRIFNKKGELIASGSGFRTKKEAMYEARSIEQELAIKSVFKRNTTLYEMWVEWHRLIILPSKLSESSKAKHLQRGKVLKKFFDDRPASKITHSEYQDFLNQYCRRVLRSQVSRFNTVVKNVLAMAIRDGAWLTDFTKDVQIIGEDSRKTGDDKYIHSQKDYERLLVYLRQLLDYKRSVVPYMLYVSLVTGFRPGEVSAITWDDIDFENQKIKTYRRFSGDKGQFFPPKTKWSVREIPISQTTLDVLLHLKSFQKGILSDRGIENEENLVFYDYRYGIPTSTAVNKRLRIILADLGLPTTMSWVGTRHTFGSYLLSKKVDIWVVAKILGHKDIQQLMETYGHLMSELEQEGFDDVRTLMDLR